MAKQYSAVASEERKKIAEILGSEPAWRSDLKDKSVNRTKTEPKKSDDELGEEEEWF